MDYNESRDGVRERVKLGSEVTLGMNFRLSKTIEGIYSEVSKLLMLHDYVVYIFKTTCQEILTNHKFGILRHGVLNDVEIGSKQN